MLVGTNSVLGNDEVRVYGVGTGLLQSILPGHYRGVACVGVCVCGSVCGGVRIVVVWGRVCACVVFG